MEKDSTTNPFTIIDDLKQEIQTMQEKITQLCTYIDSHLTQQKTDTNNAEPPIQNDDECLSQPVLLDTMHTFYHDKIAQLCSYINCYISNRQIPLTLEQPITADTACMVQREISQNLSMWLEELPMMPEHTQSLLDAKDVQLFVYDPTLRRIVKSAVTH